MGDNGDAVAPGERFNFHDHYDAALGAVCCHNAWCNLEERGMQEVGGSSPSPETLR